MIFCLANLFNALIMINDTFVLSSQVLHSFSKFNCTRFALISELSSSKHILSKTSIVLKIIHFKVLNLKVINTQSKRGFVTLARFPTCFPIQCQIKTGLKVLSVIISRYSHSFLSFIWNFIDTLSAICLF